MPDKHISLTIDTSICPFDEAAREAIALAATYAWVEFRHGEHSVKVYAAWTVRDLTAAWQREAGLG